MSIGERISELRKKNNISQGKLADQLGISRQAVSKWENDLSSPDTLNLIHLADILQTDIEFLATGRHSEPIVVKTVEVVERVQEKPVIQIVEKVVETVVERPMVQFVEKPVVKKVYRTKYIRSLQEYFLIGSICLAAGFILGAILF